MVRQSQLRSPGFTLKPAAPLELVLKGLKAVEADFTGRLNRERNKDAKSAALRKRLAQAQLEAMKSSGVDVEALTRDIRELRQQRAPRHPFPPVPGRQLEVFGGKAPPPHHFLVTPPYSYDWTETQQIDIAPATLTAYANPETGTLGFEADSAEYQVDISNAAAAVGIYFQPEYPATLSVQATVDISELWEYDSAFWAGAHTRGWAGFLMQAYDATNSLVQTPIYQRTILFDHGTNGDLNSGGDFYTQSPVPTSFSTQFVSVDPSNWYAIWFWCGGDIHAEGQNDWYSSDAYATIDASVPYFLLNFEPERKK